MGSSGFDPWGDPPQTTAEALMAPVFRADRKEPNPAPPAGSRPEPPSAPPSLAVGRVEFSDPALRDLPSLDGRPELRKLRDLSTQPAHVPLRLWSERPGEVSWSCSCGWSHKHQKLAVGSAPIELQCDREVIDVIEGRLPTPLKYGEENR